ncbi:MAG TPA: nitroreductase family deazaflavin-dependent oxidoreductase [Candidatus Limnocylindrales bacterium]|nr:nitroreductase family deazaflavin-dependent oxidoreductase [Candidatus Limnocylindrales bacterium]
MPHLLAPTVFTLPDPNGIQHAFYRLPLWGYRLGLGGVLDKFNIAALTTLGRKSGKPRFAALEYRQHGSKIYIISGWGEQANWVRNLEQHPQVTLRRGVRVQAGRAAVVSDRNEVFRALTLFYRTNPAAYERMFKRLSQRDSMDALTLPQIADRVLVVRVLPEAGPPVLPAAPTDGQRAAAVAAGALLALLVTGLFAFALGRSRRSR